MISLANKVHIYANDRVVASLYDRKECKSNGGTGNHRCDVILLEFSERKTVWVIELKGKINRDKANKAIKQIEGCTQVIDHNKDWVVQKCIIGKRYNQEAVHLLKNKNVLHLQFAESNINSRHGYVVSAVRKLHGF